MNWDYIYDLHTSYNLTLLLKGEVYDIVVDVILDPRHLRGWPVARTRRYNLLLRRPLQLHTCC